MAYRASPGSRSLAGCLSLVFLAGIVLAGGAMTALVVGGILVAGGFFSLGDRRRDPFAGFGAMAFGAFLLLTGWVLIGTDKPSTGDSDKRLVDQPSAALVTPEQPAAALPNIAEPAHVTSERAQDIDEGMNEQPQSKARAGADAKVRTDAERAEMAEQAMVLYELAKAEFDAAWRLKTGRMLAEAAQERNAREEWRERERLLETAKTIYEEIMRRFPDTRAGEDAAELLAGKDPPHRPIPPKPSLPTGISADEDELPPNRPPDLAKDSSSRGPVLGGAPMLGPTGGPKTVYVRGYTRKDGTYVRPHYRSPPGMGPRRR
jgi:hypothetical protein